MKSVTKLLHLDKFSSGIHGEIQCPVYRNIAYDYRSSSDIAEVFQGSKAGYTYGRQNNPTVSSLEKKISLLEGCVDTVAFSTGMGAINSMVFSLFSMGDHIVVSKYLFGNTRSLFESYKKYGIEVDFVDATKSLNVKKSIKENTKAVFVETISNPRTQVADLSEIGVLCRNNDILYIVDNTMTSPALFQPVSVGAHLVVNSLSKYIAGHGVSLGGAISDAGTYPWKKWAGIDRKYIEKFPEESLGVMQIRKKGLRDTGPTLSPDSSNLISIGMETLWVRMERISKNAMVVANYLESHNLIRRVYYPGLKSHAEHDIANDLFSGFGGLMSFELVEGVEVFDFIDRLECSVCSSNMGDTRSLIIPVAKTIFHEIGMEKRRESGIDENLLRLVIGIECADDLVYDFEKALSKV